MKPPDILLQCNSPKSLASTMADIDQDIDPFRRSPIAPDRNSNQMDIDQCSNRITNHDKLLANNPNMGDPNRIEAKMSFASLNGNALPLTIQTFLQDLGNTTDNLESPSRSIFDENILNDDEISRNLSDWAMT